MNNAFEDKIIIVTGGTNGIGYETVIKAAKQGAKVIACAKKEKLFENDNIEYMKLDVAKSDECDATVNYIKYEKIDALVANAGITDDALTSKMSDEAFDNVVNTYKGRVLYCASCGRGNAAHWQRFNSNCK